MKSIFLPKSIFVLVLFLGANLSVAQNNSDINCTAGEDLIGVYNFNEKEKWSHFIELNLDETHPNLLDPRNSKSDNALVMRSWRDLHKRIVKYLRDHNFSWDIEENTIKIFQKIYFSPDGKIENYAFKVITPNVPVEKTNQYSMLMEGFIKENGIDFQRSGHFAQCGKTQYSVVTD